MEVKANPVTILLIIGGFSRALLDKEHLQFKGVKLLPGCLRKSSRMHVIPFRYYHVMILLTLNHPWPLSNNSGLRAVRRLIFVINKFLISHIELDTLLEEKKDSLVIIDFYTTWCSE